MEKAGLSFSWDSENRQERFDGISLERSGKELDSNPSFHHYYLGPEQTLLCPKPVSHLPTRAASLLGTWEPTNGGATSLPVLPLSAQRNRKAARETWVRLPPLPLDPQQATLSHFFSPKQEKLHLYQSCCEAQTFHEGALRTHRI